VNLPASERDLRLAPRGLLRRFGSRRGVEQRGPLDALGRVPHDTQGEVAAHREPGERKARRRGGEDATRDRIHAVVAAVVGHLHRPESPQGGDLLRIEARGTVQPGNEDHRQRLGHLLAPTRKN